MIQVVVDTNNLVSSIINRTGNEAKVVGMVRDGDLIACVTTSILEEYSEVLGRSKFNSASALIAPMVAFFRREARLIVPEVIPYASPDPTDTKFIACALAANADYLVTGNRRHFPEPRYGNTEVVNAAELLTRLKQQA